MPVQVNQENVNDTAKLIMHRLIARALARDGTLVNRAKTALALMSARYPNWTFVHDWGELLARPSDQLRTQLTSRDQHMKRLRLSSPFVTAEGVDFTDETLRRRIRRAARRLVARGNAGREPARSVAI